MSVPWPYTLTMYFLLGNVILKKMLVFDTLNKEKSSFLILRTNILVVNGGRIWWGKVVEKTLKTGEGDCVVPNT
jgi:uncharacterized RmlC-like cupin family protein